MSAAAMVACGPSSPGYEYCAQVVRSLLPLIERVGIASAAEVDIDTLAGRVRADAVAHEQVIFLPRVVGMVSGSRGRGGCNPAAITAEKGKLDEEDHLWECIR